ncbi:MAG: hypothetical protein Ct9H300mP16_12780 [Pseudomonadota bacterium]|nr:MAG: hypothetical protein Ct9H300mP16_12780 [Pseudomonadota bacterium]
MHPSFKNINDPYGGWSAAVLARAILDTCDPELELVSLTTDYLSVPSGGRLQIDVDCDRSGRRTEFWRAFLTGRADTSPANRAIAILARRRDTLEWTEGAPLTSRHQKTAIPSISYGLESGYRNQADDGFSNVHGCGHPFFELGPFYTRASTRQVGWLPGGHAHARAVSGDRAARVRATVSMTVYLHATPADYARWVTIICWWNAGCPWWAGFMISMRQYGVGMVDCW